MAAKFTVYKDKKGEYRFNLKASNGEIIVASEGYKDKKSALKGIASVTKSATAKIVDETGEETVVSKARAKAKAIVEPKVVAKQKAKDSKSSDYNKAYYAKLKLEDKVPQRKPRGVAKKKDAK